VRARGTGGGTGTGTGTGTATGGTGTGTATGGIATGTGTGGTTPDPRDWVAVGTGYFASCALDAATSAVVCWGTDTLVDSVPVGVWTELSVGARHACAIDDAGALTCWGDDLSGSISGTPADGTWSAVAAGLDHACAVRTTGEVECWGSDASGKVSGVRLADDGVYVALSADYASTCGLSAGGTLGCWGAFDVLPDDWVRGVTAFDTGGTHTCAIVDRRVQCFGDFDDFGQLRGVPDGLFDGISAGSVHSCALDVGGRPVCWGSDDAGQSSAPDVSLWHIAAGDLHTCGIEAGGEALVCWGRDLEGRSSPPE
jgi:hypothetical protein